MSKDKNATQIPIPFEKNISYKKEDFILSPSNESAFFDVFQHPWVSHGLILTGERASGKSHLAHIWCDDKKAHCLELETLLNFDLLKINEVSRFVLIDNIEQFLGESLYEEKIFHLFNLLKEEQGRLLITSSKEPLAWNVILPDLRSRLRSLPVAHINNPDDFLLKAGLLKMFSDYQIQISKEVVDYILPRIDRSMHAIQDLVSRINDQSMIQQRGVTIPFIREILDQSVKL